MSRYVRDGESLTVPSGTARSAGTLGTYAGQAGIFNEDYAADKMSELRIKGIVEVPNPDSVSLADGATAGYDIAGDKVTAAAGGDFDIGVSVGASSGSNPVSILLNAQ